MVFMFFNGDSTTEMLGIMFVILNIFLSIFAVSLDNGKFVYIDMLLRFHMIIALSLLGCLLFPLGTVAIGGMAFDSMNFKDAE